MPMNTHSHVRLRAETKSNNIRYGVLYMEQHKIDRINELAHKQKAEGLTEQEKAEQASLRREYIEAFKKSLMSQLDNM